MGGSEKLGQQLQDGRKGCHLKDLLVMLNQQVGLWEILVYKLGSNSPCTMNREPAQSTYIGDRPAYLSACKRLALFRPPAHVKRINYDREGYKEL